MSKRLKNYLDPTNASRGNGGTCTPLCALYYIVLYCCTLPSPLLIIFTLLCPPHLQLVINSWIQLWIWSALMLWSGHWGDQLPGEWCLWWHQESFLSQIECVQLLNPEHHWAREGQLVLFFSSFSLPLSLPLSLSLFFLRYVSLSFFLSFSFFTPFLSYTFSPLLLPLYRLSPYPFLSLLLLFLFVFFTQ